MDDVLEPIICLNMVFRKKKKNRHNNNVLTWTHFIFFKKCQLYHSHLHFSYCQDAKNCPPKKTFLV